MVRILAAVMALTLLLHTPCLAAQWFEGGNLHSSAMTGWLIATDANQLATAADFVAGTTDPELLGAQSGGTLKAASQTVAGCVTDYAEKGIFDRNMRVQAAALICLKENQKKYPFFLSKAGTDPEQKKAAAPEAALTEETLRAEVRELLGEFDRFKDSPVFRQCIYGCGSDNPGKVWELRRKALHNKVTPQLDAPVPLKVAVPDLWQMGMDYAKGRKAEAAKLRTGIEAALK